MTEKKTGTHGREALAKILGKTPESKSPEIVIESNENWLATHTGDPPKALDGVTVQGVAEVQEAINRPTEVVVATMHGYAPDNMEKPASAGAIVEAALATIQDAIDRGFKFTDAQKDVGINMSLSCITETEREWFLEVSEKLLVIPHWQCLWGQFRRCHEWGLANAPLLDSGWETGEMGPLAMKECEWCHQMYQPKDRKSRFCRNECGGAEERQRLGIKDEPQKVMANDGDPETLEDLIDQAKETTTSAIPSLPGLPLSPIVEETVTEA